MLPGSALDDIECEFSYVDLDSPGVYVALSYTWGQQTPSVPILVNGKVVPVAENLYLALLHLRKRQSTTLWVDALCINQRDLQELASQVQQMKHIYQQASLVVVWLGDEDHSSALAFDAFHEMVEHLSWENRVPEWLIKAIVADPKRWKAISDTLDRPWFRRTWVIQEVLAAREAYVLCGKDLINMALFLRIIHSLLLENVLGPTLTGGSDLPELLPGPAKAAINQLRFLVGAKIKNMDIHTFNLDFERTLLNMLASTRCSETTLPQDKVYGLLSLADDAKSLGYWNKNSQWVPFRVDYYLSAEQVFIDVAKAIIDATGTFEILRFAGGLPNKTIGMPSWVPNWADKHPHTPSGYPRIMSTQKGSRKSWRDDGDDSDPARWCRIRESITSSCGPAFTFGRNDALIVSGIHFDTITNLSKHTSYYKFPSVDAITEFQTKERFIDEIEHQLDSMHTWINECTQLATECYPYPTDQGSEDALWRTLNDDFTGKPLDEPLPREGHLGNIRAAQSALAFGKNKYLSMCSNNPSALSEIVLEVALSRFETLMSVLPNAIPHQRFATTQRKYVGLVPQEARVGDLICVMHGCEAPFVLRKRGVKDFEFVGHGKIQGFDFDYAVAELEGLKGQRWEKPFDFSALGPRKRKVEIKYKRTRKFTIL